MDQKSFSTTAGDGFQPDPPDQKLVQLLAHLPGAKRVRVMLEARELAVGLIRGRLRRRYPDLSMEALNLKVLEEISPLRFTRGDVMPGGSTRTILGD